MFMHLFVILLSFVLGLGIGGVITGNGWYRNCLTYLLEKGYSLGEARKEVEYISKLGE